jgi:hypothetical protein
MAKAFGGGPGGGLFGGSGTGCAICSQSALWARRRRPDAVFTAAFFFWKAGRGIYHHFGDRRHQCLQGPLMAALSSDKPGRIYPCAEKKRS